MDVRVPLIWMLQAHMHGCMMTVNITLVLGLIVVFYFCFFQV